MELTKTREIIFDVALRLFSTYGFEKVNMRGIAAECKIKSASIYNHFASKQEILNTIYAYYREHFFDNLTPEEEIKRIVSTGTKDEIIDAISFTFESSDTKKYHRMVLASKLVYMRIFNDEEAKNIFMTIMSAEPEIHVAKHLQYGISIGRFTPFDIKTYASLLVGCRHSMALSAFANANYTVAQLEEESNLNRLLKDLLPIAPGSFKLASPEK